MAAVNLPPKNVSAFIRFCRWGLLVTGATYGYWRFNYLEKKDVKIQERENAIKARIAERQKVEKAQRSEVEMKNLARDIGVVTKEAPSTSSSHAAAHH